MATFETIKLDKGLYRTGLGINAELEKIDPSENYKGTSLEGLDAFERQLKRFDIKIKGKDSSPLEKFFQTSDAAVLFPEYVCRTVKQGLEDTSDVNSLIASRTLINSLDYRTIKLSHRFEDIDHYGYINEGDTIPTATIGAKDNLVKLYKRGRMLVASYEAVRFQRLDIFSVALRSIGANLAQIQVDDAFTTLTMGEDGEDSITALQTNGSNFTYADLLKAWASISPYKMNTIMCSPMLAAEILALPEMHDAAAGNKFHATGNMITPLGAKIITTNILSNGNALLAFDKNYALEMVSAGGIMTDFDKLIDRQLHRASITETYGFARLFKESIVGLERNSD